MTRRLRVILPPTWALILAAVLYAALEGFVLLLEWRGGITLEGLRARPSTIIVGAAAVGLGIFRVLAFHPFFRPRYREWLARTPWTSRSPLPDGPVSLIWEDAILVSVLASMVLHAPLVSPPRILTTFLVSYLAALLVTLMTTGASAYGYAIVFGFGLIAHLWQEPWAALSVALAFACVGQLGLCRSLERFPWASEPDWYLAGFTKALGFSRHLETKCGWPYDQCRPQAARLVKIPLSDAIVLSLLAGWGFFVFLGKLEEPRERVAAARDISVFMIMVMAGIRTLVYVLKGLPPISLLGRLATGRWIIPGYDQIFMASIVTCVAPFVIALGLRQIGASDEVIGSMAIASALFVVLKTGPRLETWGLTGRLRIFRLPEDVVVKVD
ncbi:hypothetical protein ACYOEI_12015 [Singulisphaera rosea]